MSEMKQSIREEIAFKQWLCGSPDNTDTRQGWNEILNRDYWLKQADSIISLFKEYVKGKELTFEQAREISVDVLGIDCVRKIGEENSIIGYKIGQIQKATVHATISKVMEGL